MTPDDLLRAYEDALGTQDWKQVEPLMHPDVCVTFSSGAYHEGRPAVQRAFTENFSLIRNERYAISNVHWIAKDDCHAACTYEFDWSGEIAGKPMTGGGRGTSLMKNEGGTWLVLAEHLGPRAPR